MRYALAPLIFLSIIAAAPEAQAAGVRDFTRTVPNTAINETQADELTLTLTETSTRLVQTWVRTAGTLDGTGAVLTTFLRSPEADIVQPGQRFRAFSVDSRTRMHLGFVSRVTRRDGGAIVEGRLPVRAQEGSRYLMEIVVERGPFLSIPNVSIIEEGSAQVVYVEKRPGEYAPQTIQTGLQGELYTQVLSGLNEGDQVVSVGSFFVDAENKLKSLAMAAMPGMDHGTMPMPDTAPAAAETGGSIQLLMTDPAASASVNAPLYMIHVMFSQPVDVQASGFEVTDAEGKAVDVGDAMPMGADGKMLMAMPGTPLPAGSYRVKWRTAGMDSTRLEGEFSFTVR